LALHAAYVVALIGAAVAVIATGYREPRGIRVEWAAMDAAFATFVAAGIVLVAGLHVLAALAWFGNPTNRWVMATSLPLAAYLIVVWFGYDRTDLVGWQLVVTGVMAAVVSVAIGAWQRKRPVTHDV
jgi:hypothetical protein